MSGIVYYKSKEKVKDIKSIKQDMNYASTITINEVFESDNELIFTNYSENYPSKKYTFGSYFVLISGLIYNMSEQEIEIRLDNIVKKINVRSEFLSEVKRFVADCDGDFISLIYSNNDNCRFIFNDTLGRLPLYYYESENCICISSEIKSILHVNKEIDFNIFEIVNKSLIGYTLGNNTIYKNVYSISPQEILCIDNDFSISRLNIEESDYSSINVYASKKEAIKDIKNILLESIDNRVKTLDSLGYKIIADLSGGFDSRAVIGGLSLYCKHVNYYTFEYTKDESPIAIELFNILNKPGRYKKLKFENVVDIEKAPAMLFNLDCLTNYQTSCICFEDVDFLYHSEKLGKAARFGGLGGEFFRHPYNLNIKPRPFAILDGSFQKELDELASVLNFQPKEYKKYLARYFSSYNGTDEQKLKRLYVQEYYRKEVGLDAEDRERIHFWGVQPFWTAKMLKAFDNIPLAWATYDFFTQIMNEIDSRLLDVDIFGSDIKLKSSRSRKVYDFKHKLKQQVIQQLTYNLPNVKELLRKILNKSSAHKNAAEGMNKNTTFIKNKYSNISKFKSIFNESSIDEYLKCDRRNQMVDSYIMYIECIEAKFLKEN